MVANSGRSYDLQSIVVHFLWVERNVVDDDDDLWVGSFCWVDTSSGPEKRLIELGDSNDVFVEIIAGLNEGEEVVLNPVALIDEADEDARKTLAPTQDDTAKQATKPGATAAQEDEQ